VSSPSRAGETSQTRSSFELAQTLEAVHPLARGWRRLDEEPRRQSQHDARDLPASTNFDFSVSRKAWTSTRC
jgi:hypothetical protein